MSIFTYYILQHFFLNFLLQDSFWLQNGILSPQENLLINFPLGDIISSEFEFIYVDYLHMKAGWVFYSHIFLHFDEFR